MRRSILSLLVVALCAPPSGALDIGYSAFIGAGAAMALGGDMTEAAAEFGSSLGASATTAPVLGASVGAVADVRLYGPLRAAAGLELRRLGYATWAPDLGATSWLALWTVGLRLGLRYEPEAWYLGAGGLACAPVSAPDQAVSQGGSGVVVTYNFKAGNAFIPGAYLEGGLRLRPTRAIGPVFFVPAIGVEAGLWPGGIVDNVVSWQAALSIVLTMDIERRTRR
ncbi:MAG: hypothetical protein KKA67_10920 [Spirochaetes bacterium]|nr:hypothetical protein [Spirochaetota bacterium]MBU1079313.1 hypothetical protein [Spirochaetota bacterium]